MQHTKGTWFGGFKLVKAVQGYGFGRYSEEEHQQKLGKGYSEAK